MLLWAGTGPGKTRDIHIFHFFHTFGLLSSYSALSQCSCRSRILVKHDPNLNLLCSSNRTNTLSTVKNRIPFKRTKACKRVLLIVVGVILCCSGLYSVTLSLAMSFVFPDSVPEYVPWPPLVSKYAIFALIFLLDSITGLYDEISYPR